MTFLSKDSYMLKIFALFIIMRRVFIMSYKFQLTLVLKLHELFGIINDTYESLNAKKDH